MLRTVLNRLTIRAQVFAILLGLTCLVSGSIGFLNFQKSYEIIKENAVHAVSLEAKSRKSQLIQLLTGLQQRTANMLTLLDHSCPESGHNRPVCQSNILKQFVEIHSAHSAKIKIHGKTKTITIRTGLHPMKDVSLKNGELATFVREKDATTYFIIQAKSPQTDSEIAVQFDMGLINKIFLDRSNLGQSGETFLTDSEGFFLSPPRYGTSTQLSHPISARPMKKCLSGKSGEVLDLDYRNAHIVHGFIFLPEIGGGCIMAHMDQPEVFRPAILLRNQTILISLVFVVLAAALAVLLSKLVSAPIDQLVGQLRTAISARDEFLGVASHELKTPLTSLTMQINLIYRIIKEKPLSSASEEKLDRLVTGANNQIIRLSNLVSDLLDTTRIRVGLLTLTFEQVDLAKLIEKVVQDLSLEITQCKCSVTCNLDRTILGRWDQSRIEQVIINLLSNAMKYGTGKPIEILTQKSNSEAIITVKDYGIGIQQEDQLRIFDRFERANSKTGIGGMGLGLFITREIVNAHGGRIWVESQPGHGSTFRVELPQQVHP